MAIKQPTSTNLHQPNCDPWISQCFLTPDFMLVISTVATLTGVTMITTRTMSAWLAEQELIVLPSYTVPRTPPAFTLADWNTGTNPDLAFAIVNPKSCLPDRRLLEKFPKSKHRPSLITQPRFAMSVPSMPVKRCSFQRAKWSHYNALTNKFAKTLLPLDSLNVDAVYQDFCNIVRKVAKITITRSSKQLCSMLECRA